jgi:hypothetical protein
VQDSAALALAKMRKQILGGVIIVAFEERARWKCKAPRQISKARRDFDNADGCCAKLRVVF